MKGTLERPSRDTQHRLTPAAETIAEAAPTLLLLDEDREALVDLIAELLLADLQLEAERRPA